MRELGLADLVSVVVQQEGFDRRIRAARSPKSVSRRIVGRLIADSLRAIISCMWNLVATPVLDAWLAEQNEEANEAVATSIELLKARGPSLGRPYADTLKGSRFANMKELRVNARRMAIRIAFAFDPQRNAILLVAGDKRGVSESRFYRQLIARADNLFSDYLKSR